MDTYTYEPLDPEEIRLLQLDPWQSGATLGATIVSKPLRNPTFQHSSTGALPVLHHSFSYEAVSYHWGRDKTTPRRLVIRGGEGESALALSNSLAAMLEQFALPDKQRTLWVDAICINQDNKAEKAEQIDLIPRIYSTAERVLVYLGPEADDSWLAIDMVEDVAKFSEYLDSSRCLPGRTGLALALAKAKGFDHPPPGDKRWAAWRAFWRRGWFRRVWIIQEFAYATDIAIFCGDRELDWFTLKLAAEAYAENEFLVYPGFKRSKGFRHLERYRESHEGAIAFAQVVDFRLRAWGQKDAAYKVLSLGSPSQTEDLLVQCGVHAANPWSLRNDYEFWKRYESWTRPLMFESRAKGVPFPGGKWDLLGLLQQTRNFHASLPVDRLYALLGLAEEGDQSDFKANYKETLKVTSRRFAAALIRRGRCQEVLSMAGSTTGRGEVSRSAWIWSVDTAEWAYLTLRRAWNMATTLRWVDEAEPSPAGAAQSHPCTARVLPFLFLRRPTPGVEKLLKDFPSWVPNWVSVVHSQSVNMGFCLFAAGMGGQDATDSMPPNTKSSERGGEGLRQAADGRGNPGRIDRPLYNAALDSSPEFTIEEGSDALVLTGRCFDKIVFVFPGQLMLSPLWYEVVVDQAISPYPTGEPVEEVVWRTLIANRTSKFDRAPASFGDEYAYLKALDRSKVIFGSQVVAAVTAVSVVSTAVGVVWMLSDLNHALRAGICLLAGIFLGFLDWWLLLLLTYLIGRLPFLVIILAVCVLAQRWCKAHPVGYTCITFKLAAILGPTPTQFFLNPPDKCAAYLQSLAATFTRYNLCFTLGGRLALVPVAARMLDEIVVFHGCAAPFVIRHCQTPQSFRLVGEAYVHGVMDGEIMTDGQFNGEPIKLI